MLPYFVYTEEIQSFCQFMGINIDNSVSIDKYACIYQLDRYLIPRITSYNLNPESEPLIPPEKVLEYLTLILNGYSFNEAIEVLGVVGNGRSSSS